MWCNLCGTTYAVQFTRDNLCNAIPAAQYVWCNLGGTIYAATTAATNGTARTRRLSPRTAATATATATAATGGAARKNRQSPQTAEATTATAMEATGGTARKSRQSPRDARHAMISLEMLRNAIARNPGAPSCAIHGYAMR
eukprot:8533565-Pyramimonas_sp.AAC.1